MSDINQDDIDKLLRENLAGEDASVPSPMPPPEEERGPASQDDIDALFAAVSADATTAAPAAKPAKPAANAEKDDSGGMVNQDDIAALFAAAGETTAASDAQKTPTAPMPAVEPDLDGVANQDDIDALFSAVANENAAAPEAKKDPAPAAPAAEPEPEPEPEGVANQDDIDALFSAVAQSSGDAETDTTANEEPLTSSLAEAEAAADLESKNESAEDLEELNALLSSIADDSGSENASENDEAQNESAAADSDEVDLDALLREVAAAAPPPPPKPLTRSNPTATAETTILDTSHLSRALTEAEQFKPAAPAYPAAPPPPVAVPPPAMTLPAAPPPAAVGVRREFSVLYGAGEVDSVANQIAALLASMSEKAHGYMQAWIAADSEAKELRTRAMNEERRRISMEGEKTALARQLDELRLRLSAVEGEKIAGEEARRTLETASHGKIRELESQTKLLSSEAESLKEELTRARNQATGVDIESRRARFEAERLRNEVEAERMERLRIQRALENREKEIQAMQSQSGGQASSLFLDELHRLVRRLESELEVRTSGAHEALKQLDRLELPESMVPAVANLRAALMQAMGATTDQGDALRNLGREASGVRGGAAVAPGKTEMLSFETAISTYNMAEAIELAGALLREARATTGVLMRKVYQCPALRRPEVTDKLSELARLLEGLRTVQEANDRSRGSETAESEVFYVQMFDFLHNLVCLKLINRLSGDIWRLFLDLRGRFSFVASDKQWAEYRDRILGEKKAEGKR